MHMYNFLSNDGIILALTSPYWTTQNSDNQILFRNWLADKNYSMKMLIDNSFIEDYKTHPSMIIKIQK